MKKILIVLVALGTIIALGSCSATEKSEPEKPFTSNLNPSTSQINELIRPAEGGSEAAQIETLIRQLGAEDFETRENAQKELIAMGESIIPILSKYKDSSDPEIRVRIHKIMETFKWSEWGEETNGLRCLVTCDKEVYSSNDPIIINCKVANLTNKTQYLATNHGRIDGLDTNVSVMFNLTDKQDKEVECVFTVIHDNKNHIATIGAGKTMDVFMVDIKEWYTKLAPGEYTFKAFCSYESESFQFVSNTLLITVTEKPTVEELIKLLDDNDWKTREAATESLIELGESVLPFMEEIIKDESASPELKKRAQGIYASYVCLGHNDPAFCESKIICLSGNCNNTYHPIHCSCIGEGLPDKVNHLFRTNCQQCGNLIKGAPYRLCSECAKKSGLCRICGKMTKEKYESNKNIGKLIV